MNSIVGSIIGAVLGLISSFGFMAMNIKKSQCSELFPIIAVITTVFGAVGGGRIGHNLEKSDKTARSLGLDNMKHTHYKVGRFWESQSTWNDVKGARHMVTTLKRNNNKVSLYNGGIISTHGTSASSVNIARYHNEARNITFAKLKERIVTLISTALADLEQT